jgi:membrane dipeptidase
MDAQELLRGALVIDGHNDTIVAHIRRGNWSVVRGGEHCVGDHAGTIGFTRGIEAPRGSAVDIQINAPLMRAAGIDAGLFAIDVTLARHNHLAYALDGLGYLFRDLAESGGGLVIARSVADLEAARAAGTPAAILAIENADVTEKSLYVLQTLHALGVRAIGLTHNVSSCAADGCLEARPGVGLTAFGVAMVREMNRLGMVVDLAHVSPGAFSHALEVVEKPVLFSHGNARALCDHFRNLTDDQLRALRDNGGVIGLSYVPDFVDAMRPTVERLLDHVDHIVGVAGIETVGLGSDFDGGGTLLRDATETWQIVEGLLDRGYGEADVRALLGGNMLRVLQAAMG